MSLKDKLDELYSLVSEENAKIDLQKDLDKTLNISKNKDENNDKKEHVNDIIKKVKSGDMSLNDFLKCIKDII